MFYYVLYQDNINAVGVSSVSEAISQLNNYPLFIEEIKEIVEYLIDHIYIKTFYIGSGLPESLEQYGCYTREDIFTILADKQLRSECKEMWPVFSISKNTIPKPSLLH